MQRVNRTSAVAVEGAQRRGRRDQVVDRGASIARGVYISSAPVVGVLLLLLRLLRGFV